ncbi:hypothetical protein KUTeg_018381, partial [Tegillarca granosa]
MRDEMMAARENVVRLEKITNQRAEWNENLELACWKKRIRNDEARIQDEVKQAAKASITVRRIALQQLLEKDHEIYEKELNLLGKTFFKQRIHIAYLILRLYNCQHHLHNNSDLGIYQGHHPYHIHRYVLAVP